MRVTSVYPVEGTARWNVECEVFRGRPGGPPMKLRRVLDGDKSLVVTYPVEFFLHGMYRLVKDAR